MLVIGTTQFSRHDSLRKVDIEVGKRQAITFGIAGAKAVVLRRAWVVGVVTPRMADRRRPNQLQPEVFRILLAPSQLTRFSDDDKRKPLVIAGRNTSRFFTNVDRCADTRFPTSPLTKQAMW
jgi:hypothetical protein